MVLERELKKMTEKLMYDHGLIQNGWKFNYGRGKKTFGTCSYTKKEIRISKHLARVNTEERVKLTILHEIAHALTPNHGHDNVWKVKCIEIGGNGRARFSPENTVCLKSNRTSTSLKTVTIHHKVFNSGDKIKFRGNRGVCEGIFEEYKSSNYKYPVCVNYNGIKYKMSTRSVIG